jgi:hypothetical protein
MYRRVVYGTLAIVVVFSLTSLILSICQCFPISHFWDAPGSPDASCVNNKAMNFSVAIISVIIDIWIFVLPLPMVWRLNINYQRKIALGLVFAAGAV